MEIKNNSIIHTVRDFALENFGAELTDDQISAELRELNFSGTLQLTNALKNNDKDLFAKYITLDIEEGYTVLPPMDRERYQEREGLEGPFPLRSGKVVYYDPREGKYYDPDTDYYLSYDEYMQYDKDDRMQEMVSPRVGEIQKNKRNSKKEEPVVVDEAADEAFEPHMMYSKDGKEEKYADTEELHLELKDKGWGHELEERSVAGGNIAPTGRRSPTDPDDVQQDANSDASDNNASEIARLKKLAGIK